MEKKPAELDFLTPSYESGSQRFRRKFMENPFVPFGALLTVCALTLGLVSFKRGDQKMSQKMMRLRVIAQGGTVLALCGGVMAGMSK